MGLAVYRRRSAREVFLQFIKENVGGLRAMVRAKPHTSKREKLVDEIYMIWKKLHVQIYMQYPLIY
jgi:hypothetical protein